MGYSNFRLNIIIRILIILAFLTLLAFWLIGGHYLRTIYIGIFIIVLAVEMFSYIDKLNNNLSNYFSSLLSGDYSSRLSDSRKGKSFRRLNETLNAINEKLKAISKEKETRSQYLGSLIDQAEVGILSMDMEGNIHLVNNAFGKLLGLEKIRTGMNLGHVSQELLNIIQKIPVGEHQLIRWIAGNAEKPFSFQVSRFKIEGQLYMLVSVHDIRAELDEKELEAWQKLIRVLTHEIMNSVTPIVSLSNSLNSLIKKSSEGLNEQKLNKKLSDGLEAIMDRSSGLMRFTTAYQNLTRIPAPKIQWVEPDLLIKKIATLYLPEMQQRNINWSVNYAGKPDKFRGDPDLIEQVLINLIRNATEAVTGRKDPRISLDIDEIPGYQVKIKVEDNGPGINKETMDKIFVPFFSTKPGGSGIGLSLSRQIIMMHRGSIEVSSKEEKGCKVEILL
jgi:two-component system nitrogen regulation sensor histidine kinase NtrY